MKIFSRPGASVPNAERRAAPRTPARLLTVVVSQTFDGKKSREVANTVTISPLGLAFVIKRTFEVGQLIHLSLPLPSAMRKFGSGEGDYDIWAIVRYCNRIMIGTTTAHQIGVAFVGQRPPRSYEDNPYALFRVNGRDASDLWTVAESGATIDRRSDVRHPIPIELSISVAGADGTENAEHTVTENISRSGAVVYSSLGLQDGDIVKIESHQYNVVLQAAVVCVRTGSDGIGRCHLAFIDGPFPLGETD